jgi:hypothetical protein
LKKTWNRMETLISPSMRCSDLGRDGAPPVLRVMRDERAQ